MRPRRSRPKLWWISTPRPSARSRPSAGGVHGPARAIPDRVLKLPLVGQRRRRALPGNAGVGPDDLAQGRIGEIVDGARPLCGCRGLAQRRGTLPDGSGEFGMWLIERVVDDAPTEGKAAISQCGPAFDEQMDGLETYIWTSLTSRGDVRTSRAPTLGDFWPRDRGVEGSRCSLRMKTNDPNGVSYQ